MITFAPNSAETQIMSRFLSSFVILLTLVFSSVNSGLWSQDHAHDSEGHESPIEEGHHEGHDHSASEHQTPAHEADDTGGHDHADGHHDEEFIAGEFIIHHIADAHDIHLFGDVHIPLPVLLYIEDEGMQVFMSSAFEGHGHGDKHFTNEGGIDYTMHAEDGKLTNGDSIASGSISAQKGGIQLSVFDFSITKSVFGMLMILALMVWMFLSIARSYNKNPGTAPKGMANAMEPLILFIRDEIAKPSIGDKADKFMPFLLTVFFFIFFCNLLGLVPFLGGFNITGTIGVTVVLSTLVFLLTNLNGNKHYWGHLFSPPGVPLPVKFILVPIEVFGVLMKPAVLMIRLTANISAGHIIILAFTSLIFIFGDGGQAIGAGTGMGIFSTAFMIFMYFLELLVAFLQAFVFTLLAAIYFGDATHDPAHH
ncbi:MAG: ATP synthase F0 subunit A [Crocinitomicaceae bacterium]|nr:ATP synthase F0 subunit A [Crocinitomicaceae bacterium]